MARRRSQQKPGRGAPAGGPGGDRSAGPRRPRAAATGPGRRDPRSPAARRPADRGRGRADALRLRKPLERAVAEGHPWVFRQALEDGPDPRPGTVVTLLDRRGRFLARGVAEAGPIALRVWTTRDEPVDDALLARRVDEAVALRADVVPPDTDAHRVLHGEGDGVPGLVCDRYGPYAVVKIDGEGARRFLGALAPILAERLAPLGVTDVLLRAGRGADKRLEGLAGRPPADPVTVRERGVTLVADLHRGQKTGLFLDQRESRARVRALARGRSVLNLYGYTGGFSVTAALGGARRVVTVDVAADALELARRTFAANPGAADVPHVAHAADVPTWLVEADDAFDLVVCDPPSFAPSEAARPAALAAYARLHAAALARVRPGGLYLAASCSSHVDLAAFTATLARGARDAGRALRILDRWGAPPDHPRLPAFPEGDYLGVVLCRAP